MTTETEQVVKTPATSCVRCEQWTDNSEKDLDEENVCRTCRLLDAAVEAENALLEVLVAAHNIRSDYYGGASQVDRERIDSYVNPITEVLDLVRDIRANIGEEADPFEISE